MGTDTDARLRLARFLVLILSTCTVSLAQSVTITEYAGSGAPTDITAGPDGALWFVDSLGDIHRMSTAGTITATYGPSGAASYITAGPDGALWFTEPDSDQIGRITTTGVISEYQLPAGSFPVAITAGPDGALWFTEYMSNHIGRITTGGVVSEYSIPTADSGLGYISAGVDGALWFTEQTASQIGRISTAGKVSEYPIPSGSIPYVITSGADGALWFTEAGPPDQIGRISTAGVISEYPIPTSDSGPLGITAGPDGALWFTERSASKIGRISVAGLFNEYPLVTSISQPAGITKGPDGALWFAEVGKNKIGRAAIALNSISISKTHSGNFTQGQANAQYTLTVTNNSAAPTNAMVTVGDTLPTGLTLVSMSGTGWSCTSNGCSRNDVLPAGQSYPSISVLVNVASNAPFQVTNQATLSGGGSPNATASDLTNVNSAALSNVINVTSSTANGTYGPPSTISIQVSFSGVVVVTGTPQLALNSGGTAKYSSGSGSATLTFTYVIGASDSSADLDYTSTGALTLNGGTLNASLILPAPGAAGSLGANKNIVIGMASPATFFTGEAALGSGVYYLQFPNGNLFGYYNLQTFPIFYHYDLGFEAFVDGGNGAAYLYDFAAGHWFYTSAAFFPYLFDFTLNNWIYYFPDTKNAGHYTTNPRYFSNLTTGKIFTM